MKDNLPHYNYNHVYTGIPLQNNNFCQGIAYQNVKSNV
jgi:hypothetical protein